MTSVSLRWTILTAMAGALCAGSAAFAQTSAAPASILSPTAAPISLTGDRLAGTVTAVDPVKHTITLTTRFGGASKTVALAQDAVISITGRGSLSDLKIGETIRAYGSGATPQTPTVTATRITEETAATAPVRKRKAKAKAGFSKKSVEGVVATTSPLTLTTAGGVIVTVNTSPSTKVATLVTGTLADVKVGATVNAKVSGTDSAPIASDLRVMPERGGARKGNHRRKKAALAADPVAPNSP